MQAKHVVRVKGLVSSEVDLPRAGLSEHLGPVQDLYSYVLVLYFIQEVSMKIGLFLLVASAEDLSTSSSKYYLSLYIYLLYFSIRLRNSKSRFCGSRLM